MHWKNDQYMYVHLKHLEHSGDNENYCIMTCKHMWGVTRNDHLARVVLSIITLHLPEFQQEFYWHVFQNWSTRGAGCYRFLLLLSKGCWSIGHYHIGKDGFHSERLALVTITNFSLYTSQEAHHSGANPAFPRMKQPGVFLLLAGWNASPSQGYMYS